jgi:acyl-CoA synthetase (AMP-forming)/AMP-acid ligase II
MLVSDIVRRNAQFFADDDAVVVPGGRTSSWGELDEQANMLANAYARLGLAKGDRVAIYAPNCGEYVEFFFGCAKSGVIGAPTNIRLAPYELLKYLQIVEPRAVLVHSAVADEARRFLGDLDFVEYVVGIGDGHGFDLDYAELVAGEEPTDPGVSLGEHDVYQLGATSGTTGLAKAAILTHANAIAGMFNWLAEIPVPKGGTSLQNIPLFFNPGGPAGLHPVLMKGGRSVIFPAFETGNFLRSVPEYAVTHCILVPTMIGMVLAHPECEQHDLSSLLGISCGGSPLPREVLARAREVFGDVFFPMFGMAESYSCGLILRREDQHTEGTPEQVRRLTSAGKPQLLMQVRVVDPNGEDVPHDNATPGEIWMTGASISPGYFRQEEETALSREGDWLKTGDVAVVDDGGYVTIVDRLKDIIITGGINVFSRDIEDALYAHPAVAQVAAIGIPHEQWGEAIHAVVVLKPGSSADEDELLEFAASRLAGFKKPRSLEIVDELPMSATGKILKKDLRLRYWSNAERPV